MTLPSLLPRGELDKLAHDMGTDKSSRTHDYMRLYEFLFKPFKDEEFCFMELGVGLPRINAASLRSWRQFFTKARIVGVDNDKRVEKFSGDEFKIRIGDASDPAFLTELSETYQPSIVLDDASHKWSHQITAFKTMFPLLPPGGLYVIEDIFTSFPMPIKYDVYADHPESCWTFISRLQAALAGCQTEWPALSVEESELVSWIDAVFLTRRTVIFVKREAQRPEEIERVAELRRRQGG
ncbi:MAG: hypothetical protein KBT65_07705 [Sulfitobacter sp.]|nr:hypothetical protein [Sulfitobacter sp.]